MNVTTSHSSLRTTAIWATVLLGGDLSWAALYTTLELGRTAPTAVSRDWLTTLLGASGALMGWQLLFGYWLRRGSDLRARLVVTRVSASAVPLLGCTILLVAAYLSDWVFHYLFIYWVPRGLVLWAPLLAMLALQEATLVWSVRLGSRAKRWLCGENSAPLLIFLAFATLYIYSAGGHLYTPDEGSMYRATQKLVQLLPVQPPCDPDESGPGGLKPEFSKYGLVPSLLAIPPYWISRIAGPQPDPPSAAFPIPNGAYPLVDLLVNPLLTAATCAVLYCMARRFGFRASTALTLVLLYGLTTSAWVYAKTFLSQPAATFFLLVTTYLLHREKHTTTGCALAGFSLGLAAGSRAEILFLAAPLGIPILRALKTERALAAKPLVFFAVSFLLAGGTTLGWYNWVKTGYIWATGHGAQGTLAGFSTQPLVGLVGTFTSPGFSFPLYNPIVVVGLISVPLLIKRRPWEGCMVAAFLILGIAFYGSFGDWKGGFTWGNRYLVVMLPFSVLPVGTLLESGRFRGLGYMAIAVAAIAGFFITFSAVIFDFNSGWLDLWEHEARERLIMWNPSYSPILAHARLFHDFLYTGAKLDLYIYYKLGFPSLLAFLLMFTAALTLAARAAYRSGNQADRDGLTGDQAHT